MKILIHIYPDEDGVHCGKCPHRGEEDCCAIFRRNLDYSIKAKTGFMGNRLPECLKAEREAKEKKK